MPPTIKQFQNDPYEQYTRKVASAESGGKTTAKNPFGAAGLFQFVPSTWRALNDKYNLGYSQDDRLDPEKSNKVMKLFTEENKKQLSKRLGRQPNDYELYLAHGFGASGAGRLIEGVNKNPNIRTDQFFSPIILKQNRALLFNKDGSAKTLGDISNHFKAKMSAPVTKYTNSEKEITPEETVQNLREVNNRLTDLVFTKELPNFAGTSYTPEEDESVKKLEEKEAEKEVIREREVIVQQPPQEQEQTVEEDISQYYVDPNQTYAEIDSFLQMQTGGTFRYRRPEENFSQSMDNIPKRVDINLEERIKEIQDAEELRKKGSLSKPKSALYKSTQYTPQQPMLSEEKRNEEQKTIDVNKGNQKEYRRKVKENILKPLDVASDIAQIGNFVPHPVAQGIGKIGNITGGLVDGIQAIDDFSNGDYTSATINSASMILPNYLASKGFRRNSKHLSPGDPLYNLSPQSYGSSSRAYYIEPFTQTRHMSKGQLNNNRALLGALGTETYLDINYEQGGEIPTSNLGMWQYPNQTVRVPSPNITMQGINHQILGISEQTGERKIMQPNQNYFFDNTKSIIEIPLRK